MKRKIKRFSEFVSVYKNLDGVLKFSTPSIERIQLHAYIASFVAGKLILKVKDCVTCRSELLINNHEEIHRLIDGQEYNYSSKHLLQIPQYRFV